MFRHLSRKLLHFWRTNSSQDNYNLDEWEPRTDIVMHCKSNASLFDHRSYNFKQQCNLEISKKWRSKFLFHSVKTRRGWEDEERWMCFMKYSVCFHAQLNQAIHKIGLWHLVRIQSVCMQRRKLNNWREHVMFFNTRWQHPSFQWVNTARFPVDLLHEIIKMWSQAADWHFKQQEDG